MANALTRAWSWLRTPSEALSLRASTPADTLPKPTLDKEFGAPGTPILNFKIGSPEYNRALTGKQGIQTYEQMRLSDAQTSAALEVIKLPLLGATWRIEPGEHADAQQLEMAAFCQRVLFDDDSMPTTPWLFVLRHALLMLDYGFSVVELVWTLRDGQCVFASLEPRLPPTIEDFEVDQDLTVKTIFQRASKGATTELLAIPASNAVVFVHQREGANYWGRSLLRAAYKHWFIKDQLYNIDAIRHDRYGVGIPKGKLLTAMAAAGPQEMAKLQGILESIRSHERAYLIEPPDVDISILSPGGTFDTGLMASIEHHDVMIARAVLAPFMNVGQATYGTKSSTIALINVFYNALEGLAKTLASIIKSELVVPLCQLNFPPRADAQYPNVHVSEIAKTDPAQLATMVSTLISATLITPDDDLENLFRKLLGWPLLSPDLSRKGKAAAPPPAGPRPAAPAPPGDGEGEGEADAA